MSVRSYATSNRTLGRRRTLSFPSRFLTAPCAGFSTASRQRLPRQQQQLARCLLQRWRAGELARSLALISADKNEAKQLKRLNDAFSTSSTRDNESLERIPAFAIYLLTCLFIFPILSLFPKALPHWESSGRKRVSGFVSHVHE